MRQEENTELIEDELGDCTVLTAIFSLCSRTILHILLFKTKMIKNGIHM